MAPRGAAVRPDTDCLSGDLFTSHDEEESMKLQSSQRALYLAKLFRVQNFILWMLGHGLVSHHSWEHNWEISGLSPVTTSSRLFTIMQQCNTKTSSAGLLLFPDVHTALPLACLTPWLTSARNVDLWSPLCQSSASHSPKEHRSAKHHSSPHIILGERTTASASYTVSAGKPVTQSHFHLEVLL